VKSRGFGVVEPALGDERMGIREEDLVVMHAVVGLGDRGAGGDGVRAVF